jgi:hypothetical protein
MEQYTPCDCEQCTELRASNNPETIEFMKDLDKMEEEHFYEKQNLRARK